MKRISLVSASIGTLLLAACAQQPAPAPVEYVQAAPAVSVEPTHTGKYK
ncbi:hypothetical protein [Falsigemmobacter intermedius]|nr:hypothetical protein [Falsigemmobacter intermedius]